MKNRKKILLISLVSLIAIALIAVIICVCGKSNKSNNSPDESITDSVTTTLEADTEIKNNQDSESSDSDTVECGNDTAKTLEKAVDAQGKATVTKQVFSVNNDNMSVTIEYPQVSGIEYADDFNLTVFNSVSSLSDSFIRDYYEENEAIGISLEGYYSVSRNDEKYISVLFTLTYELGGAHPTTVLKAVNYSLEDNETVKISDVLGVDYFDSVANAVLEKISESPDEYYDDVDVQKICDCFNDENFALTDTGITVFFAEYDLAPHATGVCQFDIPYAK